MHTPQPPEHLLFVYGTLMRNESNHHLLRTAHFVTQAHTLAAFTLYNLGAYPGMVAGGTSIIRGEVFRVDAPCLTAVDALEQHPDYYRRQAIQLANGWRVQTYLFPDAALQGHHTVIPLGDWRQRHTLA